MFNCSYRSIVLRALPNLEMLDNVSVTPEELADAMKGGHAMQSQEEMYEDAYSNGQSPQQSQQQQSQYQQQQQQQYRQQSPVREVGFTFKLPFAPPFYTVELLITNLHEFLQCSNSKPFANNNHHSKMRYLVQSSSSKSRQHR